MEPATTNHKTTLAALFVVFLTAAFFFTGDAEISKQQEEERKDREELARVLSEVPVSAHAVSVYNLTKGEKIYGKNDNVSLPIASLAKIMTVTLALNIYGSEAEVYITAEAIKQSGDFGLLVNEKWKMGDLAKLIVVSSANDGAYAISLADPNFLDKLNIKNQKIGALHSWFLNPTGLDINTSETGAYATAEGVNAMAGYAFLAYPEIWQASVLSEITLVSESGFTHTFKNTNTILDKIPNLLFSKTGFTEIAGGSLVVIFKNGAGEEVAVTVLGSTFDGRFSDMEKLVEVLYNN